MSSSHADRQVLWEADVAHLKQTAAELLETNSRYASMFEILKADSVARQAELQARLQAVQKENKSLRNAMSTAARVHMMEVENMTVELRALRSAVGGVGRDASRSSDEQLAQLADVNKALVSVIAEKDRFIEYQQRELQALRKR